MGIFLIIAIAAVILSSFGNLNTKKIVMNHYKDNDAYFDYPKWLQLNTTTDRQLFKLNKNDDLFVIWKFPSQGKNLTEYFDVISEANFGRIKYDVEYEKIIEKGNSTWYISCGNGISKSGEEVYDCYGITHCAYIYIFQMTSLKGTSFPKDIFEQTIDSFVCLRS